MLISAATEMEISALSPEEEAIFLEEYGIKSLVATASFLKPIVF